MDVPGIVVIVAAHNEADRIEHTLGALNDAFPGARIVVADDASTDDTAAAVASVDPSSATTTCAPGKARPSAASVAGRRSASLWAATRITVSISGSSVARHA